MYVCMPCYSSLTSRVSKFQGFIYDPTVGSSTTPRSVIYDPTVGSSTTPRSGHLRPHGRVIYDPTVGSPMTPRSGHLRPHGRVIYDPTVGSSTIPRSGRLRCIFPLATDSTLWQFGSPHFAPVHSAVFRQRWMRERIVFVQ